MAAVRLLRMRQGWMPDRVSTCSTKARLSTFPIRLPALRERREDISLLAASLLERVAPRPLKLAREALARLSGHDWPGNVRELRNVLERAALLTDGERIEAAQIEQALAVGRQLHGAPVSIPQQLAAPAAAPVSRSGQPLHDAELGALAAMAAAHKGSRADLARQLGISERSLYRKLREFQGST